MKKRAVFLFLISVVFTAAAVGCGQKKQADSNDSHTSTTEDGDDFAVDSTGTESAMDTEDTSQLKLGSAVEIPASFESWFAETDAHPDRKSVVYGKSV